MGLIGVILGPLGIIGMILFATFGFLPTLVGSAWAINARSLKQAVAIFFLVALLVQVLWLFVLQDFNFERGVWSEVNRVGDMFLFMVPIGFVIGFAVKAVVRSYCAYCERARIIVR